MHTQHSYQRRSYMRGLRVPRWVMLSSSARRVWIFTYIYILHYIMYAATAQTLSPARNVAVARSLPIREERFTWSACAIYRIRTHFSPGAAIRLCPPRRFPLSPPRSLCQNRPHVWVYWVGYKYIKIYLLYIYIICQC